MVLVEIKDITRVNRTGQRNGISRLPYSCVQTSRHWGG